jgi:hypothetical protein
MQFYPVLCLCGVHRYSIPGGYSSKAIRPIALAKVMSIAQMMKAEFPGSDFSLSGIGGVETGNDAAEFILLGANTVQVMLQLHQCHDGVFFPVASGNGNRSSRIIRTHLNTMTGLHGSDVAWIWACEILVQGPASLHVKVRLHLHRRFSRVHFLQPLGSHHMSLLCMKNSLSSIPGAKMH